MTKIKLMPVPLTEKEITFRNKIKNKQLIRRQQKVTAIANETMKNVHTERALNKLNRLMANNSAVKWLVIEELRVLERQLTNGGLKSFIPNAEMALLRCIQGYRKATSIYNGKGQMKKTTEEYVGPDYQAAIAFLKFMCPKKWGAIEGGGVGDTYNIINADNIDVDIERLTRVAGTLLERKMIPSTEIHENVEECPPGHEQIENTGSSEAVLQSDTDRA